MQSTPATATWMTTWLSPPIRSLTISWNPTSHKPPPSPAHPRLWNGHMNPSPQLRHYLQVWHETATKKQPCRTGYVLHTQISQDKNDGKQCSDSIYLTSDSCIQDCSSATHSLFNTTVKNPHARCLYDTCFVYNTKDKDHAPHYACINSTTCKYHWILTQIEALDPTPTGSLSHFLLSPTDIHRQNISENSSPQY
jgi:hypothetical protein